MKDEKYSEAIIHYTHAIQDDSKNHLLYSNRSLAFLKMQQYYYAMEDAKETIKLQPIWPKVILIICYITKIIVWLVCGINFIG